MPENEHSIARRAFISMENVTVYPPFPRRGIHNGTDETSVRFRCGEATWFSIDMQVPTDYAYIELRLKANASFKLYPVGDANHQTAHR
jgi:hypothetical protein